MSAATKADLRRAVIKTAALTHWKHNGGRIGIPANINSTPAPTNAGDGSRPGLTPHPLCPVGTSFMEA